ncbi:MAG: HAMP domain-containing sensor histidine kinase [Synechococcales bacterium]|nr:HAMP domain-containing sensor histidine kinase [Synechococcales bacterium]
MFHNLYWRLLATQLTVMAAILVTFGIGVYSFFYRNLYNQLDKRLLTLAQSATPTLAMVEEEGEAYLEQVNEVPWRDIFNRDRQSLEWFDVEGQRLAKRGSLELPLRPQVGVQTWDGMPERSRIRTYTISVFEENQTTTVPKLQGYIRASQSLQEIDTVQRQLLWGLGAGGAIALGLSGVGGLWLVRKSLQPVEDSFETLKQFTADASHELRNPLTAIKTSLEVMQNHPERIHPKDAKKLEAMASATAQMRQLTDDLLFLARTDASLTAPFIPKQPVELSLLIEELITLLEPSAQAKGVALQRSPAAQIVVLGDANQLRQLFRNLIQNALQYTPRGGRVTVTLTKQARQALVHVEDTGIGIAPEQLPFIFDRFWRADKARSRRRGGTGLGLAIAQAIAKQHRGTIIVQSQAGIGSCFQVHLPLPLARVST